MNSTLAAAKSAFEILTLFYETTSRSTYSLVDYLPQPTSLAHFDLCNCQLYFIKKVKNLKEIQQGNWLHHDVPLILSTPKLGYFLLSEFDPFSRIICEDLTALPAGKKYRLTLQIIACCQIFCCTRKNESLDICQIFHKAIGLAPLEAVQT